MEALKYLIIISAFLLTAAPVWANKPINVDEKVQKMKTELNLTDEQTTKVRGIIEDYKIKVDKAGEEKETRLTRILSATQMEQLKAMKKDKGYEADTK